MADGQKQIPRRTEVQLGMTSHEDAASARLKPRPFKAGFGNQYL
jgi:hypothetical protein